jgi:hypothetical protein
MSSTQEAKKSSNSNVSLNDILTTPALKTELATVTALCSDAMRRELLAVFEPVTRPDKGRSSQSAGDPLIDFDDNTKTEAVEAEETERLDIQSPRAQALRRAAVTYFDKWQIDVLRRLGEVLSVRPDVVRKARADAKARADEVAKEKRDRAYWEWANGIEGRLKKEDEDPDETDALNILPEGFEAKILNLSKDKRILLLDSVLLLLLSLEHYSAHSRVLMLKLTRIFRLPESTLIENESKVAKGLLASAASKMSADESTRRQAAEDASARRWKVGLATVAGAALIGVTGGLAAPILAAGIGGIMGGIGLGAVAALLGPLATNMVLVGSLFGAYGGKMTGQIMEKYAQEIKDFKFISVSSSTALESGMEALSFEDDTGITQLQDPERREAHKLRVAIGISGSITEESEFITPWTVFSQSRIEAFGLRWELDALVQLGRKISEVLQSVAWDFAKYQLLSMVLAGLWPFGLLRAAGTLDSPFAIAKTRSDKAGKVLADALINKVQGARPVTLIGYGLGARVIYSCLLQLAELNAFGLVESVVFMGAATPSNSMSWRRIRAVVSGRVINVFSEDDFMLGFLYRASSVQMGIAGVQEIKGVTGVENFNFTEMIKGHDSYKFSVGTILQRIGFADIDNEVIRQQQDMLRKAQQDQKAILKQNLEKDGQSKDNLLAKEEGDGRIVMIDSETPTSEEPGRTTHRQSANLDTRSGSIAQPSKDSDEDDITDSRITMEDNEEPMSMLAPEPEPDYGPDRETVRFGSGVRGFNLEWDNR